METAEASTLHPFVESVTVEVSVRVGCVPVSTRWQDASPSHDAARESALLNWTGVVSHVRQ